MSIRRLRFFRLNFGKQLSQNHLKIPPVIQAQIPGILVGRQAGRNEIRQSGTAGDSLPSGDIAYHFEHFYLVFRIETVAALHFGGCYSPAQMLVSPVPKILCEMPGIGVSDRADSAHDSPPGGGDFPVAGSGKPCSEVGAAFSRPEQVGMGVGHSREGAKPGGHFLDPCCGPALPELVEIPDFQDFAPGARPMEYAGVPPDYELIVGYGTFQWQSLHADKLTEGAGEHRRVVPLRI
jgi:hypothetical protein